MADHDPLTGLHPLECLKDWEDDEFAPVIRSIYNQLLTIETVTRYVETSRNLHKMLYGVENTEEIPTMNSLLSNWKRKLVHTFLLRFRNMRFHVVDGVHTPASNIPTVEQLIIQQVGNVHRETFHEFALAREAHALDCAQRLVVEACRAHSEQDALNTAPQVLATSRF